MINPTDSINIAKFNLQNKNLQNLDNFSNIKGTKAEKDEKLKQAARDFEAVFINQFFNTIESTVQKSEFLHGGQAENTFKTMLNEELSKQIAQNPSSSFGLAEQIYAQMKNRIK